ncbi:MAG: phage terminase small subunit P27 family [Planctomycetota bacterium]
MKLAKGTGTADDAAIVKLTAGDPQRPPELEAFGEVACRVWDETVEKLGLLPGLLSPIDARALMTYCIQWQRVAEAQRQIEAEGLTCTAESGAQYQHPAVGVQNKAFDLIHKLHAKFSMTPSDRAGIKPGSTKQRVRRKPG